MWADPIEQGLSPEKWTCFASTIKQMAEDQKIISTQSIDDIVGSTMSTLSNLTRYH